ncbi:membrane protein insertion efficiency factor YidD [Patescibacteria group bacterium]|nr:membrane protein insertion efficiency factor YidD [Patescibacteria group bacterium]MCG2701708.1 membrane protein insertion efficiency factor YidD [Candidatus Parcubacteria bacterium]MBU4265357.1 membrane protein insertion efficiency factor YidD [Patescibacteria group bacterium]MBU4390309.1 membrane protein insertion efficiency factor YidD [Patescibacteria group bacterium]MBU4396556.1 membrane protein insertion efficiency factor YidD [Patescibacteria group bacterium]
MIKKMVLKLLVFYKKYVSRGSHCRFYPTCSQYTYKSIEKYGVVKGGWMGVKRVMKCNPFYKSKILISKS